MTDWRLRAIGWAVALTFVAASPTAAADAAAAGIYAEECAFCHGESGGGDGVASTMLTPRPTAFSNAAYWKSADRVQLAKVIAEGKAGTGMMGFSSKLSATQIKTLVTYLETFAQ